MERKFRLPVAQCDSKFYKSHRSQLLPSKPRVTVPPVAFEKLSEKQQLIVRLVDNHLKKSTDERKKENLSILALGCAGAGKSAALLWVKKLLEEKEQEDPDFAFKAVSYTGMAAFNVNAETIHSAFHINPYAKSNSERMDSFMKAARDPKTAKYYAKVQFLLVDEVSTCGLVMLSYINSFLQLTHPGNHDKPLAGVSCIFFGDPFQTRAIGDYSAWEPLTARLRGSYGYMQDYYFSIKNCFFLDKSFRQGGGSDDGGSYFDFLTRLRNQELSPDDIEKIRARMSCRLGEKEWGEFEEYLHHYPLRRLAAQRNRDALHARYKGKTFVIKNGEVDLQLAIDCRVMLRTNLCLKAGLCNGSKGTLVDVVFTPTFIEHQGIPECLEGGSFDAADVHCLLIDFPGYIGNLFLESAGGKVGLPVYKIQETVEVEGEKKTVETFKLELAYGMTVHKAQGLTLDRVAIWLDGEEWFTGLDYVAFSRTRELKNVMVLDPEVKDARFARQKGRNMNRLKLSMVEEKRVRARERTFLAQMM